MHLSDDELNAQLKARGWLTMDEQFKPGPLDLFTAHAGVHDNETFQQWAEMRMRELLRFKAFYDLGIWTDEKNEEYHLGQLVVAREMICNLRKIANEQR